MRRNRVDYDALAGRYFDPQGLEMSAGELLRGSGVRKAYASKGDDATLSRFVKVRGHKRAPGAARQLKLGTAPHPAELERRTYFPKSVTPAAELRNVLVSGHSNVKIGRDVRKGPLRGYWIYTLTLQERATCPSSCVHWGSCYGNNMPWAKRVDHRDPLALEAAIHRDVTRLLAVKGRPGILVRLHALGDFFDEDYVDFWANMLATHPRLAVYGYTAHPPSSQIGAAIDRAKAEFGRRFAIRWSNGGEATDCTVSIPTYDTPAPGAFLCPEQTGKTAACATCGLCWGTDKNVAFVEH
jgi:hypothetical protein